MLKQLYIRNYALFAETQVTFPAGLNILTGETGAGKSLLVGALGLIQGRRVDNSVIFIEEDKCIEIGRASCRERV
jgi:DNA repair protein RecN (Recombination protein N)